MTEARVHPRHCTLKSHIWSPGFHIESHIYREVYKLKQIQQRRLRRWWSAKPFCLRKQWRNGEHSHREMKTQDGFQSQSQICDKLWWRKNLLTLCFFQGVKPRSMGRNRISNSVTENSVSLLPLLAHHHGDHLHVPPSRLTDNHRVTSLGPAEFWPQHLLHGKDSIIQALSSVHQAPMYFSIFYQVIYIL